MAAFNRPTEATYEVHENITVDTSGKDFSKLAAAAAAAAGAAVTPEEEEEEETRISFV